MKALKITFLLLAVVVLTVSVVSKDDAVQDETKNYKEYTPKNKFVIKRKKGGLVGAS